MAPKAVKKKRPYNREGRDLAAAASRRTIAEAARKLFASHGYAATTIEMIASESGYAVPTVYFHFKSKAGVLSEVIEHVKSAANLGPLYERSMAAIDPVEQVRITAEIARSIAEQGADLFEIVRAAGSSDPVLATVAEDERSGRLFGMTSLVRSLAKRRKLRPGVDETSAIDIAWSLTGPELYRSLVVERGWTPDRYEHWLASALERELLR